ncbi:protein FAM98B-like [Protopterus annectens]|uniref:protein FAM98B-like n=1 Tax=Protopterus annectens TaxID=7888 RepID=UPI001CF9E25C|nr:protein FAM98B-like [Protopterus annectens]
MVLESDILDTLEALGYKGPLLEEEALLKAAESGASSTAFTELCVWLAAQLKQLGKLEEGIVSTAGADDVEGFQLEVSGFLKELACPYSSLISGEVKERLKTKEDCLKLLLFLSTELQAMQIVQSKPSPPVSNEMHQEIEAMCKTLDLPKPSASTISQSFSSIESKIKELQSKIPKGYLGNPLLKSTLTSEQWEKLKNINAALCREYDCRQRMLLKRLDVTVQSFDWSERAKVRTL